MQRKGFADGALRLFAWANSGSTSPGVLGTVTFCLIGQMLFAISASIQSYPLAVVGRLVFGFGGESMSVALSTILVRILL